MVSNKADWDRSSALIFRLTFLPFFYSAQMEIVVIIVCLPLLYFPCLVWYTSAEMKGNSFSNKFVSLESKVLPSVSLWVVYMEQRKFKSFQL